MDRDYRLLVAFVRRVQRGLYGRRLLQGGVLALTVLLAVLLLGAGVQLLLPLVPVAALFYSGLALLVLVATALYVVWPAVRPVRLRQAVVETEKAYPELHDDLTNALELDPQALARHNPYGMALDLVRALHRHTARRVQQLSAQAVVRRQPLLGLPWCGLLLVATALVALLQPTLLTGALQVGLHPWEFLAMRRLEIRVAPQHAVVARGTNVEVTATVQGRVPRRLFLVVKREGEADKRYPMEAAGDGIFRYLFVKPQNSFTFQAEARGVSSPPGRVEVVPAPAVGHLVLQYRFPAYTGLAPRTQEGGGDIQALPGTQVQLRLRTNVPVVKGVLRFADGSQLPLQIAETTLQGEILVTRDGAYTIEVEDRHGLRNPQPPRYQVQVIPDRVPTVAVRFPPDGAEVDETTVLHVEYTAEDDFGLQDAALVYFGADGVERRISLHPGRFAHPRVQETFSWDMQQWPLPAGDTVQFYVEVYDNDTISGPKRGVSPTQTLKVRNRQQEHEELQGLQERLAEAFLDLLADHLEQADRLEAWQARLAAGEPPSPQALEEMQAQPRQALAQVQQLAQQLAEALDRVQNDPYSTYETYANLRAMQRNLEHLQQSLLPRLQAQLQPLTPQAASPSQLAPAQAALEETIRELERLATLAEQTTHAEKLHDLAAISNKLLEEQNRLLSALNDLPPDFRGGELPPELQALLDRLEDLMQQLAQAVSQLPASLPDEFLNRQLETLPLQELLPQLQELRQKLAAGDLEGARQLAEALLKTLSAMVAALQNMQQQARGGPMEAMQQQLQTSANKLNELIQRQERLLDQTQRIDQQALQQLNQAQRQAYAETQRRLEAQLRALSQLAWDLVQQAQRHPELDAAFRQAYQQLLKQLHTLQRQLEAREIPEMQQELQAAQQQLAWMQRRAARLAPPDQALQRLTAQAQEQLAAMHRALEQLPRDRHAMLTPAQRQQLAELGQEQGAVRQDTQALQQAFEGLLPLMPFLPSELSQNLQEALPWMGQAEGALHQHRSQQAVPPEQQALEHLRSAQNGLQQALQEMAQRGQMMGMSMPMLRQTGRLPMPMLPQPDVDEQQNGVAGASVRNFQLPDREAYKVPRLFREDVMEALKEGYPARYKELIEQYYRNIVR